MDLKRALVQSRLNELKSAISLEDIITAITDSRNSAIRTQWVLAIHRHDDKRVGQLTMQMVTRYLIPTANDDADASIAANSFTAEQVANLLGGTF